MVRRIKFLQERLAKVRDGKFVTLGAIERDAQVRRGWCRDLLGGKAEAMRTRPEEVQRVEVSLYRLRKEVCGDGTMEG